jgi:hypothetical protein
MKELKDMSHYAKAFGDAWVALFAFVVGLAASYWGEATEALKAALLGALCVTIADTILGVVVSFACPAKRFSSHSFARVFSKLLVYMCSMLAAYGIDMVSQQITGAESLVQLIVATMICFREISSVMEHSDILGVPWPEAVKRKLDTDRKRIEDCISSTNKEE